MRNLIRTLVIFAPFVALFVFLTIGSLGPQTCTYHRDITLGGHVVKVEHCEGRWGAEAREDRIVERYS
jgi:hypothetical protein